MGEGKEYAKFAEIDVPPFSGELRKDWTYVLYSSPENENTRILLNDMISRVEENLSTPILYLARGDYGKDLFEIPACYFANADPMLDFVKGIDIYPSGRWVLVEYYNYLPLEYHPEIREKCLIIRVTDRIDPEFLPLANAFVFDKNIDSDAKSLITYNYTLDNSRNRVVIEALTSENNTHYWMLTNDRFRVDVHLYIPKVNSTMELEERGNFRIDELEDFDLRDLRHVHVVSLCSDRHNDTNGFLHCIVNHCGGGKCCRVFWKHNILRITKPGSTTEEIFTFSKLEDMANRVDALTPKDSGYWTIVVMEDFDSTDWNREYVHKLITDNSSPTSAVLFVLMIENPNDFPKESFEKVDYIFQFEPDQENFDVLRQKIGRDAKILSHSAKRTGGFIVYNAKNLSTYWFEPTLTHAPSKLEEFPLALVTRESPISRIAICGQKDPYRKDLIRKIVDKNTCPESISCGLYKDPDPGKWKFAVFQKGRHQITYGKKECLDNLNRKIGEAINSKIDFPYKWSLIIYDFDAEHLRELTIIDALEKAPSSSGLVILESDTFLRITDIWENYLDYVFCIATDKANLRDAWEKLVAYSPSSFEGEDTRWFPNFYQIEEVSQQSTESSYIVFDVSTTKQERNVCICHFASDDHLEQSSKLPKKEESKLENKTEKEEEKRKSVDNRTDEKFLLEKQFTMKDKSNARSIVIHGGDKIARREIASEISKHISTPDCLILFVSATDLRLEMNGSRGPELRKNQHFDSNEELFDVVIQTISKCKNGQQYPWIIELEEMDGNPSSMTQLERLIYIAHRQNGLIILSTPDIRILDHMSIERIDYIFSIGTQIEPSIEMYEYLFRRGFYGYPSSFESLVYDIHIYDLSFRPDYISERLDGGAERSDKAECIPKEITLDELISLRVISVCSKSRSTNNTMANAIAAKFDWIHCRRIKLDGCGTISHWGRNEEFTVFDSDESIEMQQCEKIFQRIRSMESISKDKVNWILIIEDFNHLYYENENIRALLESRDLVPGLIILICQSAADIPKHAGYLDYVFYKPEDDLETKILQSRTYGVVDCPNLTKVRTTKDQFMVLHQVDYIWRIYHYRFQMVNHSSDLDSNRVEQRLNQIVNRLDQLTNQIRNTLKG
jgi:hypothetical protein